MKQKKKRVSSANRTKRSRGRALLQGQDMGKTQDHRNGVEQRLAVGGGWWRLAVGGRWRLAVGGPWRLSLTNKKKEFSRAVLCPPRIRCCARAWAGAAVGPEWAWG